VDSWAVLAVPVTNENEFLSLLKSHNLNAIKESDEVYTVTPDKGPTIYLRLANGYAFASVNSRDVLNPAKLLAPARIFSEKEPFAVSASLRVDQIPDVYKQLLLSQTEPRLTDAAEKKSPGETEEQHAAKARAAKKASEAVASIIKDGGEITLRIAVDRKGNEIATEIGLSSKPGSALASQITSLGKDENLRKARERDLRSLLDQVIPGERSDSVRISIEGGSALKLRLAVGAPALRLIHELRKSRPNNE
jgi:hypothetical protein